MNKPTILVVEDDAPVRNLITTTLKTHDYKYLCAPDGKEAVLLASSHNPDVVFLDLGLPDMDGIDVIKHIVTYTNSCRAQHFYNCYAKTSAYDFN